MKFVVRLSSSSDPEDRSRLGYITELTRRKQCPAADVCNGVIEHVKNGIDDDIRDIETPACFIYTKRGSIPNITSDVFHKHLALPTQRMPIIVPIATTIDMHSGVQNFNRGFREFVGLEDHIMYTSVQDPAMAVTTGYNDRGGISVWGRFGRLQMDVDKFMQIQETFRPDMYQALCDSDTGPSTGKKRTRKAVDRSLEMLDECIERHSKSSVLKDAAIFGNVQGGYCVEMRQLSAKQTALRPISGFIIEGFYNYGPESEELDFKQIKHIIISTLKFLPENKPRVMHGIWKPINVIEAVQVGIDLFDSSYPSVLADRGIAFVLPLRPFETKIITNGEILDFEIDNQKTELDINAKSFSDDFSSLVDDCPCHTCCRFTKAYINHLLNTSEMLAMILLTIHNVKHYLRFFNVIRTVLSDNRFSDFKQYVMSHDP